MNQGRTVKRALKDPEVFKDHLVLQDLKDRRDRKGKDSQVLEAHLGHLDLLDPQSQTGLHLWIWRMVLDHRRIYAVILVYLVLLGCLGSLGPQDQTGQLNQN